MFDILMDHKFQFKPLVTGRIRDPSKALARHYHSFKLDSEVKFSKLRSATQLVRYRIWVLRVH